MLFKLIKTTFRLYICLCRFKLPSGVKTTAIYIRDILRYKKTTFR